MVILPAPWIWNDPVLIFWFSIEELNCYLTKMKGKVTIQVLVLEGFTLQMIEFSSASLSSQQDDDKDF